jgi:hypothetical protein
LDSLASIVIVVRGVVLANVKIPPLSLKFPRRAVSAVFRVLLNGETELIEYRIVNLLCKAWPELIDEVDMRTLFPELSVLLLIVRPNDGTGIGESGEGTMLVAVILNGE